MQPLEIILINTNTHTFVSIPQAVGTVATVENVKYCVEPMEIVSIPQAVGTVATALNLALNNRGIYGVVSIPQAVGTVATKGIVFKPIGLITRFQYRKR